MRSLNWVHLQLKKCKNDLNFYLSLNENSFKLSIIIKKCRKKAWFQLCAFNKKKSNSWGFFFRFLPKQKFNIQQLQRIPTLHHSRRQSEAMYSCSSGEESFETGVVPGGGTIGDREMARAGSGSQEIRIKLKTRKRIITKRQLFQLRHSGDSYWLRFRGEEEEEVLSAVVAGSVDMKKMVPVTIQYLETNGGGNNGIRLSNEQKKPLKEISSRTKQENCSSESKRQRYKKNVLS